MRTARRERRQNFDIARRGNYLCPPAQCHGPVWDLVNTVFALKYARLYYRDEDGGIDFKQEQAPAYSDSAYMAFTVGMSFAVSESELAGTRIRKSRTRAHPTPTPTARSSSP